jgi:IS605 OrfB family transposase
LVIDDVIYNILKSIYYKTVFWIKKLININKTEKIDKKYETIINNIKNDDFYIENYNIYSKIIKEQLNIPKTTVKNLIGRVTYKHIYENKEKIPADVIGNIIDKTYGNIESYYSLLKSGKQNKTSLCKYLNKDAKFNLFYFCRSFKVEENKIRLNVGDFINNNYKNLIKDCKLDIFQKNKKTFYYNKLDLVNKKLNKNYEKIDEYFIDKTKLQTFNYIYLQLPKKIKDCKIKLIEIKSFYNYIKFYITYEYKLTNKLVDYDLKNFDNLSLEDKLNKSISIDTGVVNLLTIYDPTGKQFIIKGGQILSINHFYNKWLDKLKSLNKKLYNKSKFNRLYSLETERQNKINGYFNNVINLLLEKYSNKELFIIGYNPNWKSGVNLGKKNNRNFYQIPYKRFLNKLDDALKIRNKKLLIVKESYTSICDSLALEEINYHETYKGIRTKRGIFSSSTKKLINSDINGAINIMRKYIPLNKITGRNIFNPQIIKP